MTTNRAKLFSPLQRAIAALAVSALIWLSLRNAAIALFAQAQPSLALVFWPPSGAALAVDAAESPLPPAARRGAIADALARAPVSHWPMLAAAEAAIDRGETERAVGLLEAAVRRNSRHVDSRSRLFQLYMSQRRWSEAIDEGLALARLRPAMSDSVMEAFLTLLPDMRGRAALAARLRSRADGSAPPWRESLVRAAAGHPSERPLAELLRQLRSEPGRADRPAPSPDR